VIAFFYYSHHHEELLEEKIWDAAQKEERDKVKEEEREARVRDKELDDEEGKEEMRRIMDRKENSENGTGSISDLGSSSSFSGTRPDTVPTSSNEPHTSNSSEPGQPAQLPGREPGIVRMIGMVMAGGVIKDKATVLWSDPFHDYTAPKEDTELIDTVKKSSKRKVSDTSTSSSMQPPSNISNIVDNTSDALANALAYKAMRRTKASTPSSDRVREDSVPLKRNNPNPYLKPNTSISTIEIKENRKKNTKDVSEENGRIKDNMRKHGQANNNKNNEIIANINGLPSSNPNSDPIPGSNPSPSFAGTRSNNRSNASSIQDTVPVPSNPSDYFNLFWIKNLSLPCIYYEVGGGGKKDRKRFQVQPICCNDFKYSTQVSQTEVVPLSENIMKGRNNIDDKTLDFTLALLDFVKWDDEKTRDYYRDIAQKSASSLSTIVAPPKPQDVAVPVQKRSRMSLDATKSDSKLISTTSASSSSSFSFSSSISIDDDFCSDRETLLKMVVSPSYLPLDLSNHGEVYKAITSKNSKWCWSYGATTTLCRSHDIQSDIRSKGLKDTQFEEGQDYFFKPEESGESSLLIFVHGQFLAHGDDLSGLLAIGKRSSSVQGEAGGATPAGNKENKVKRIRVIINNKFLVKNKIV
jgi:hypothetical protein